MIYKNKKNHYINSECSVFNKICLTHPNLPIIFSTKSTTLIFSMAKYSMKSTVTIVITMNGLVFTENQ